MRNPETTHTILPEDKKYDQPTTKHGRELDNAKRLEDRKEGAEQLLVELLKFLGEKLGKAVTLADLPNEFGELGRDVTDTYESFMNEEKEGESFLKIARFVDAKTKLLRQIEAQQ